MLLPREPADCIWTDEYKERLLCHNRGRLTPHQLRTLQIEQDQEDYEYDHLYRPNH